MTFKKKVLFTLLTILLLGIAYAANYAYRYALIGAGYNAKTVCSCVFISGRSLESVVAEDLYGIPYGTKTIDTTAKTATATLFGVVSKTALYRPKLGCTILNEVAAEELRQQPGITESTTSPEVLADSVVPQVQQETLKKRWIGRLRSRIPTTPFVRGRWLFCTKEK